MANLPQADWLTQADFAILADQTEAERAETRIGLSLPPVTDAQVADLVAFLNALTGETATRRPMGVPTAVPSGLPVD